MHTGSRFRRDWTAETELPKRILAILVQQKTIIAFQDGLHLIENLPSSARKLRSQKKSSGRDLFYLWSLFNAGE